MEQSSPSNKQYCLWTLSVIQSTGKKRGKYKDGLGGGGGVGGGERCKNG